MFYRIYCFLTKIPHVGIEKFNRKHRILRYKIIPNPTKMLVKKWGISYRIHCYLTKFPHVGIEKSNTIEFSTTKYFLRKMLQMGVDLTRVYWSSSNQYERYSASTTNKNIRVKKWENKKAGVKKKRLLKKVGKIQQNWRQKKWE